MTERGSSILSKIDSPADIRGLSGEALETLAEEVREFIIETVSRTGGHLASSLGAVELTIAMLKVFSPPDDRVIFDVGHQAYAYKILTGRRDVFGTLRTRGGVSGFPKRDESSYDFFDVGHAGNAISVAAGLAQARCLDAQSHKVIALVGDGSLTCGVSYEGLNQAGAARKDLVIILNDNEMSISHNVGAMAAYLNRIMTGQMVTRFRREVKGILSSAGSMGRSMYGLAKQFEEALKGFVTPGRLFEDLGFKYVGPIDGHRIKHLTDTFENVKRFQEPVLIHTITCKGKGYCLAEEDPSSYHGVAPFEIQTGRVISKKKRKSYTSAFGETMVRMAAENDKILAITAAMEYGTGLADFARIYPDRFFDVGIAEQHGVIFSAGLALEGFRPVVAIYSTFLQRGYDHLVHDVCMQGLPVTLAMDRAGIVGEDGPTHHGVFDIAFARHIPNLVMMAPSDANELANMVHTAITIDVPCAIRYPRASVPDVPVDPAPSVLEIGKGRLLVEGEDLVIVALGSMVQPALAAAEELNRRGVSAGVLDARFVKPLDTDLILEQAEKTLNVLTVEEGILAGGFGSAVLEALEENRPEGLRVQRLGIPDRFVEHGARTELLEMLGLDAQGIMESVLAMLETNNRREGSLRFPNQRLGSAGK